MPSYHASVKDRASCAAVCASLDSRLSALLNPGVIETHLLSMNPALAHVALRLTTLDALVRTLPQEPTAGRLRVLTELLNWRWVSEAEDVSETISPRMIWPIPKDRKNLLGAVRALDALRQAGGKLTTTAKVRARLDGCNHDTTFHRWVAKLPAPLFACIDGGPGAGIWLQLPPPS
jgi:hypothetical protein